MEWFEPPVALLGISIRSAPRSPHRAKVMPWSSSAAPEAANKLAPNAALAEPHDKARRWRGGRAVDMQQDRLRTQYAKKVERESTPSGVAPGTTSSTCFTASTPLRTSRRLWRAKAVQAMTTRPELRALGASCQAVGPARAPLSLRRSPGAVESNACGT